MNGGVTTLVMAGAREAQGIITGLLGRGRSVIASLPEPERMFDALPVPTRLGVFPNTDALESWLLAENVSCVIDASHAFDAEVSDQAAQVCLSCNIRYVRVLRTAWLPTQQDSWTNYPSIAQAAIDLPRNARAFSNTGRASLPEFADFKGEALFLRQTQKSSRPPPFHFVKFVVGTPPFSQQAEENLLRELKVSRLICRNVGGIASKSKLLAARRLGIRVSMIERPDTPEGMPLVTSVAEAMAWEANP
ncbi:MAG: precorrin-6A/cobalt-precorrin-6A reductase [Paracoccaceae bacterium]|nr:precorrin-6A/cobalt-precorrin-6A reductase [Paracoccaceae bacterium]